LLEKLSRKVQLAAAVAEALDVGEIPAAEEVCVAPQTVDDEWIVTEGVRERSLAVAESLVFIHARGVDENQGADIRDMLHTCIARCLDAELLTNLLNFGFAVFGL
jgi:hypothetical protein